MPEASAAGLDDKKVAVVPSPMAAVVAAAAPAAALGEGEGEGAAAAAESVGWCWCCVRAPPFSAAHPPLSKRELFSWFMYDWANSACSSVVISGFLPLLTQDSALGAAGFPRVCPNVVRDAALIAAAGFAKVPFAYSDGLAMYRVASTDPALLPDSRCVAATGAFGAGAVGSVCPNFPSISDLCLRWPPPAAGSDAEVFGLFVQDAVGTSWVPAAYTNSMNSLSTGLCIIVFIACSAFADYGPFRRSLFVAISTLGGIFCIMALGIRPASWQLGGVVMVFTTILYSTSYVFYNAWLPLLAGNDPATLRAPKDKVEEVFQARMHDISSRGYYVSALTRALARTHARTAHAHMRAHRTRTRILTFDECSGGTLAACSASSSASLSSSECPRPPRTTSCPSASASPLPASGGWASRP